MEMRTRPEIGEMLRWRTHLLRIGLSAPQGGVPGRCGLPHHGFEAPHLISPPAKKYGGKKKMSLFRRSFYISYIYIFMQPCNA